MKSALTKLMMSVGLLGALALGLADPTLARTSRSAASTDKILHHYTCDDYWMARGYYPHYYASTACYTCGGYY